MPAGAGGHRSPGAASELAHEQLYGTLPTLPLSQRKRPRLGPRPAGCTSYARKGRLREEGLMDSDAAIALSGQTSLLPLERSPGPSALLPPELAQNFHVSLNSAQSPGTCTAVFLGSSESPPPQPPTK